MSMILTQRTSNVDEATTYPVPLWEIGGTLHTVTDYKVLAVEVCVIFTN